MEHKEEDLKLPWEVTWEEDEHWITRKDDYPIWDNDFPIQKFIVDAANAYFPARKLLAEAARLLQQPMMILAEEDDNADELVAQIEKFLKPEGE